MKRLLLFLILFRAPYVNFAQDHPMHYKLFGELGEELGSTHTVIGVIFDGPLKGYESGLNILVQIINGKATQHVIQIPVSPYFGKFGESSLPKIETGATYRLRVYETGQFLGVPSDAYREANIPLQTSGFYFQNRLEVISGEKIDSIEWSPIQFPGQEALLAGIAKNEKDTAFIVSPKWKLKLIDTPKWTKAELGKQMEVFGKISETKTNNSYSVINCQASLVNLEDQLNKPVKLRGRAISMNGEWWFNYRGTDISIGKLGEQEKWGGENHFRSMEITGILELIKSEDVFEYYQTEYIIRNASWMPIKELLAPELKQGK